MSKRKYQAGDIVNGFEILNCVNRGQYQVNCLKCQKNSIKQTSHITKTQCRHCRYAAVLKYSVGEIVNNFEILGYKNRQYSVKCVTCQRKTNQYIANLQKNKCPSCNHHNTLKFSKGDRCNNYEIIEYSGKGRYLVKCIVCQHQVKKTCQALATRGCQKCRESTQISYSVGSELNNFKIVARMENYFFAVECLTCHKTSRKYMSSIEKQGCGHCHLEKNGPQNPLVYFFTDSKSKLTKIGRTIVPNVRFVQVADRTGLKPQKIHSITTNDCIELEKILHQWAESKNVIHEWFHLEAPTLKAIYEISQIESSDFHGLELPSIIEPRVPLTPEYFWGDEIPENFS